MSTATPTIVQCSSPNSGCGAGHGGPNGEGGHDGEEGGRVEDSGRDGDGALCKLT